MNAKQAGWLFLSFGLAMGAVVGYSLAACRRPAVASARAPFASPALAAAASARPTPDPVKAPPATPSDSGRITLGQLDGAIRAALNEEAYLFQVDSFGRLARSIDLADIPAALAVIGKRPESQHCYSLLYDLFNRLVARWAQADLATAFVYVQALPISALRDASLRSVLAEWAVTDSAAAVDWAKQLPAGKQKTLALHAILGALASQDPHKGLAFLDSLAGSPDKRSLAATLINSWAENDPGGAAVEAMKRPFCCDSLLLSNMAVRWADRDPQAALAWVQSLSASSLKRDLLNAVVCACARRIISSTDFKQATDFAVSLPPGAARRAAINTVARHMGEANLNAAIVWIQQLADPQARVDAFWEIRLPWAKADPQTAVAHALKLEPGEARNNILSFMVETWAATDPQSAASFVLSQAAGNFRNQMIGSLLRQWGAADPAAALQWAQKLPDGSARNRFLQGIVQQMANTDSKLAAALALSLPTGEARRQAICSVTSQMAQTDLSAAIAWAQQLTDLRTRQQALQSISYEWAQFDPQAAADYALKLEPGQARNKLIASIIGDWARANPNEALVWAQNLPANRNQALVRVIEGLVYSDPKAAAAVALEQLPPGSSRNSMIRTIASQWAEFDAEGAIAWVKALPDGPTQRDAADNMIEKLSRSSPKLAADFALSHTDVERQNMLVGHVVSQWADQDLPGAIEFVATLPAGDVQNRAVNIFVNLVSRHDPATAAAWSATIGDDQNRIRQMEVVARHWMQQDEPAARAWIDRSSLPDENKKRLIDQPR